MDNPAFISHTPLPRLVPGHACPCATPRRPCMSANAQPKRPQAAVAAALAAALMVSAPVIGWASVEHVNLENDSLRLGTGSEVLVAEADADAESSKDGANGKREAKIEARVAKDRSRRNSRVSGNSAQIYATARREAAAGNLPEALATYDALLEAAPDFAPAHSNRANILVTQGKLEQALPEYTAALELAPLEPDVWVILVNRACVYRGLGQLQLALQDFNASLATGSPDLSSIYSNRASVYERMEKWDLALRDYQRAIEANASNVQPWWIRYAMVLYERDRSVESLGILRRVAARFEASDVHAAMAGILFSRGDLAEAEGQWSMVDRPTSFSSSSFLQNERMWTPKMVKAMEEFSTTRAKVRAKAAASANLPAAPQNVN